MNLIWNAPTTSWKQTDLKVPRSMRRLGNVRPIASEKGAGMIDPITFAIIFVGGLITGVIIENLRKRIFYEKKS